MTILWKDGNYLDGTLPSVAHNDSGFANGLGVFDSMLAKDNVLIDPGAHFDRLLHDVDVVLGIGASWLPGFLNMTEIWLPLLSKNHLNNGHARIKTIITGGISNGPLKISPIPSVIVTVASCGAPENIPPARCIVIRDFPRVAGDILENCKRLDYSRSFAARRRAQELGADEAILTNTDDNVACAATSNLYIRENGVLITPPLRDGVMAGIARQKMIAEGTAIEESISIKRLHAAKEIFLTNSFVGLRKAILIN